MITVKTLNVPVQKLCEVRYYVVGHPVNDLHFEPSPDFIVDNRYFDTREEAELLKEEKEKIPGWVNYEICEKIVKIFD